jgi:hypothetical protein
MNYLVVEHLAHAPKIKGLNPTTDTGEVVMLNKLV